MAKYKQEGEHDVTFVKGGSGHMAGQQSAGPMGSGVTGKTKSATGVGPKFASGGKTKMYGFSPSQSQKSGRTSAR